MYRQDPSELNYVRRITQPNSKEIKYVKAEPNEEFWRFTAEIQPNDLQAVEFTEKLDVYSNNVVVGEIEIDVKLKDGLNHRLIEVNAETNTNAGNNMEMKQTMVSHITTALELQYEMRREQTETYEKTIEIRFVKEEGYKVTQTTQSIHTEKPEVSQMMIRIARLQHIMSEGSCIVLQRLMPKVGVYEIQLPYIDIDSKLISLSSLSSIGHNTAKVKDEEVETIGIKRMTHTAHGSNSYKLWLFEDGHICYRENEYGELQTKVNKIPELIQEEEDKIPFFPPERVNWRNDIMLRSAYRQRATAISRNNQQYLVDNPQIMSLIRDFYMSVITEQPEDLYQFASDHFTAFSS